MSDQPWDYPLQLGQPELNLASKMTLRDFFAGAALQGMHARDNYDPGLSSPEQRANIAYLDADAMLERRKE